MKMKAVVLLVVAVGCGLVAMLGVQQVLSGNQSGEVETAKVLVAIAEIVPGTPLNEENTIFKELPLESIPEGAVTDPTDVVDKSLKSTAVPGEFIMLAKLTTDLGASNEIPKGMRVVTTSVNLTKTHSGLIRPGDRVDILLSYKVRSPDQGMIDKTMTILEYIEVFATDSIMASQDQGDMAEINAKNLSFLVTPHQAAILNLAESKGDLNLSLRHKLDDEHVAVPPITDDDLNRIFNPSFGQKSSQEDGKPGPMLSNNDQGSDIRNAIERELNEPPAEEAVEEPAVEDIPMWTVVIYSGNDVLEQEVPLPLDEDGLTEEQAVKAKEEEALAEREAQVTEREAAVDAREAALNRQPAAVGTLLREDDTEKNDAEKNNTEKNNTEKNDTAQPETNETTAAPKTTEVSENPAVTEEKQATETERAEENTEAEEKTQAVKKDTDTKVWIGVVKRFLTGA
jgi:pilus assembly protein CpaB